MKTVAKLRSLGFTLKEAEHAEGCTVIEAQTLFYYFNPKFCDKPEQVLERLQVARPTGIGDWHGFTLAGDYYSCPDTEFPFVIISRDLQAQLSGPHRRMVEARAQERRAREELLDVVDAHLGGVRFGI